MVPRGRSRDRSLWRVSEHPTQLTRHIDMFSSFGGHSISSSGAAMICQYRLLTDSKEKACDIHRIILVAWTAGKGAATCCGSTVSVANGGLLVFSGPDSASRKNMSIYTSTDSGKHTGGRSKTCSSVCNAAFVRKLNHLSRQAQATHEITTQFWKQLSLFRRS